jgi:hypothetical protein
MKKSGQQSEGSGSSLRKAYFLTQFFLDCTSVPSPLCLYYQLASSSAVMQAFDKATIIKGAYLW